MGHNALLWFDLGAAPQSDVVLDFEVEAFAGDGHAVRRICDLHGGAAGRSVGTGARTRRGPGAS